MNHVSVLLEESITGLNLKKDSIVVDATLGLGGHSEAILKKIKDGFLYCFEQDEEAIEIASKNLKNYKNFVIIDQNFKNMKSELSKKKVNEVDAILFDLGVSSLQLDDEKRGFSFHNKALLDMRMDKRNKLTAWDVVNEYSLEELSTIFWQYGEEKYSKRIASAIVKERNIKKIDTTIELAEIIKNNVPIKYRQKKHPARKVFQAIRIEVNDELASFEEALQQALLLLAKQGRLAVITFHSLEDRICSRVFKEVTRLKSGLEKLPIIPESEKPKFKTIKKISASSEELINNRRARSAKLRIIERI